MKLTEKIFKIDNDDLFTCDIYYNEQLTKGLYLAGEDKYIKRNVKNLSIGYQVPNTKEKIGIKFSKQFNFVVLTVIILDDYGQKNIIQFILKDSCKAEHIYNCKHYILSGFREYLIDGLQLLYAKNLEDAKEWVDEMS